MPFTTSFCGAEMGSPDTERAQQIIVTLWPESFSAEASRATRPSKTGCKKSVPSTILIFIDIVLPRWAFSSVAKNFS